MLDRDFFFFREKDEKDKWITRNMFGKKIYKNLWKRKIIKEKNELLLYKLKFVHVQVIKIILRKLY